MCRGHTSGGATGARPMPPCALICRQHTPAKPGLSLGWAAARPPGAGVLSLRDLGQRAPISPSVERMSWGGPEEQRGAAWTVLPEPTLACPSRHMFHRVAGELFQMPVRTVPLHPGGPVCGLEASGRPGPCGLSASSQPHPHSHPPCLWPRQPPPGSLRCSPASGPSLGMFFVGFRCGGGGGVLGSDLPGHSPCTVLSLPRVLVSHRKCFIRRLSLVPVPVVCSPPPSTADPTVSGPLCLLIPPTWQKALLLPDDCRTLTPRDYAPTYASDPRVPVRMPPSLGETVEAVTNTCSSPGHAEIYRVILGLLTALAVCPQIRTGSGSPAPTHYGRLVPDPVLSFLLQIRRARHRAGELSLDRPSLM